MPPNEGFYQNLKLKLKHMTPNANLLKYLRTELVVLHVSSNSYPRK